MLTAYISSLALAGAMAGCSRALGVESAELNQENLRERKTHDLATIRTIGDTLS
jgi:hypothetical protein